jgi:probable HAF family extracellular repeat protein
VDNLVPTRALAINDDGVVVGAGRLKVGGGLGGYDKPFRTRDGVTSRLDMGGPSVGLARSVNAHGEAAGWVRRGALLWSVDGGWQPLARPPACRGDVLVGQLNDVGQMAGTVTCLRTDRRAASLTQGGVTVELGKLPGDVASEAVGINNAGQVAGTSTGDFPHPLRAFRWEGGVMWPLGDLGGGESQAEAINAHGHVIGQARDARRFWRPFLHDGVTMHALPTCGDAPTRPMAINSLDQVVGVEEGSHPGAGAVLIAQGACHRLADLLDHSGTGWTQLAAYDINDAGVIVGSGRLDGIDRAFIARPLAP